MKKFFLFLVLIITCFSINNNINASERPVFRYSAQDSEMSRLKLQDPKIREVYGEITAISSTTVELKYDGEDHLYKLLPQAVICCNGLVSVWDAVRPVSGGAYFEARVLLDGSGAALFINAFYYGESCVINGWDRENGRIHLLVYLPGSGDAGEFILANEARTPEDSDWLTEGREIFVLYNYKQEIRAVFLPE